MEKNYALRTIAILSRVLGVIAAIITVLVVLAACLIGGIGSAAMRGASQSLGFNVPLGGVVGGVLVAVGALLYGGFLTLYLLAISEGIYLLLNMRRETFDAHALLQRFVNTPPSAPNLVSPPPAPALPVVTPAQPPSAVLPPNNAV